MDTTSQVDGQSNASLAVWALPDANSIATARRVRERLEELKKSFPADLDYIVSLDMTPFIKESIQACHHPVRLEFFEAIKMAEGAGGLEAGTTGESQVFDAGSPAQGGSKARIRGSVKRDERPIERHRYVHQTRIIGQHDRGQ